jgi:hypothetical protein
VTTRKDIVRLAAAERAGIAVLDIAIRWSDPVLLARLLAPILPPPFPSPPAGKG